MKGEKKSLQMLFMMLKPLEVFFFLAFQFNQQSMIVCVD